MKRRGPRYKLIDVNCIALLEVMPRLYPKWKIYSVERTGLIDGEAGNDEGRFLAKLKFKEDKNDENLFNGYRASAGIGDKYVGGGSDGKLG